MTREHKLSLILGFAVVLVVGVLLSDHLSGARMATLDQVDPASALTLGEPVNRPTQPPALVLVDSKGRPVEMTTAPVESVPDPLTHQLAMAQPEPQISAEDELMRTNMFRHVDEPARTNTLAHLGEQVRGAIQDLANGSGPMPAAQIDTSPATLKMTNQRAPAVSGSTNFKTYTVQANDTLWAIAERMLGDGFRHSELAELNKDRMGSSGELRVGTSLRIPVSVTEAARVTTPAATTAAKPAAKTPTLASAKPTTTYVVKSGDTLGEISYKLLGTSKRFREILEANRDQLDDADSLRSGMKIKIPAR